MHYNPVLVYSVTQDLFSEAIAELHPKKLEPQIVLLQLRFWHSPKMSSSPSPVCTTICSQVGRQNCF